MPSAPDDASALGHLRPPTGASPAGLTAWATDDLAAQPWVTLHRHRLPFPPPAFWYVVEHLTVDRHWNRTIFAQGVLQSEHVDVATARAVDAPYVAPPPPHTRVHALRLLRRKTPAPIGGPSDQDGRAYDAHEWTAQWTEGSDDGDGDNNDANGRDHHCDMDCECVHDRDRDTHRDRDIDGEHDAADQQDSEPARHIACFGLSLPESVVTPANPRALRYWPFQYPKARCYRFVYERWSDDAGGNENQSDTEEVVEGDGDWLLRYEVVPLGDEARSPREFATLLRHARPAAVKMVQHLRKRMKHFDVTLGTSTYVKRVTHDHMISEVAFRRWYDALKLRHAPQIQDWLAMPDVVLLKPYEELSIAAYLCALWEAERADEPSRYGDSNVNSTDNDDEGATRKRKKQTFVDVGCGNGLLVYLLLGEGHFGCGYDLQKRPIWDLYPQDVRDALHHEAIDPATFDCSPYDWIVGNHSDELSPWVPVMAARAQARLAAKHNDDNDDNDEDDEHDNDNGCLVAEEEMKRPMCDAPDTLRREEGRDEDEDDDDDCSTEVDTTRPQLQKMRLRRAYPRFIVIPCCFFDFDGRKLAFGHTRRTIGVRAPHGMGKYEQYYRWIEKIMRTFGFTVEYENLRIPSTKYVSLMGRFVQYEQRIEQRVIDEMTSLVMLDARQSRM